MSYLTEALRTTPQSEPILGTSQARNSAGGYSFAVDNWERLNRFLVLGSEGGSYYAQERPLTIENANAVLACIAEDGPRAVRTIVSVSIDGRAPKNDPALFALALACAKGDESTRRIAWEALPAVARIGTHLLHFVAFYKSLRGWGRMARHGVANWYLAQNSRDLAFQLMKYQSRDKWSHRDVLRLSHVKAANSDTNAVLHWAVKGWEDIGAEPHPNEALLQLWAFERAKRATDAAEIVKLIADYNLPRECVPTQFLTDVSVWEALLAKMPLTAMARNLATMTRVGLIAPLSTSSKTITERLHDQDYIRKSRLHPLSLLVALRTYAQGHGERGNNTWVPVPSIIDALNDAFYLSFGNVVPTGKRTLLALDVSGSMSMGAIAGCAGITPRTGSAAMSLVTAAVESDCHIMGFSSRFVPLNISPKQRLDDAERAISNLPFEGTDCSLPMLWALENKAQVDTFVIYTDSETWAGRIHPPQALAKYRHETGIAAKLVVVGMVSNGFTIADPNDAGMLDVVGFDTAAPNVISDFARS